MTSVIQHYRSTVAGNVPAALTAGRIGINHTDGNLLYRNAAGAVAARPLRDYGVVLARGDAASVANLILDLTPATIGIMRGFVLRIVAVTSATAALQMRMGDVTSIKSGATDYNWYQLIESTSLDYDGGSDNNFPLGSYTASAGQTIDMEILLSTNDPTPTMYRRASWRGCYRNSGSSAVVHCSGGAIYQTDMDITRVQILPSTGTLTKIKYALTGLL